jgi:hypothetical protein
LKSSSIQVSTDHVKVFFGDLQRCPPIDIVCLDLENSGCRLSQSGTLQVFPIGSKGGTYRNELSCPLDVGMFSGRLTIRLQSCSSYSSEGKEQEFYLSPKGNLETSGSNDTNEDYSISDTSSITSFSSKFEDPCGVANTTW